MRRAGLKSMPAGTNYFYFFVSRMDPGFHDSYEVLPLQFIIQTQNPRRRLYAHRLGLCNYYSSYVTRDGRPVHRNCGLVTERNLNVGTSTLRVGHLARRLYATVTTRIH
jgi:hypothetical protein